MGSFGILALIAAALGLTAFASGDDPAPLDADPDPVLPDPPQEEDASDDTGATFLETPGGVTLELGEDETGSLAVIYYVDTEDRSDPDDFIQVDEARFYLVPEGVDWSGVNWETRTDIPGLAEHGDPYTYELADFEAQMGLELLGVVDLLDVPRGAEDPEDRLGEITANAPVAGYFLEATTDGDELVSFLPQDYVITRNGVPETPVGQDTTGTEGVDWITTDVDGLTLDGGAGDDILVSYASDVTLIGGEGNDTVNTFGSGETTILAGDGDDSVSAWGPDAVVTLDLGDGDDSGSVIGGTVHGGAGADTVYASPYQGEDRVTLYGDAGDDLLTVYSGQGEDRAFGGAGDDTVAAYGQSIAHGGLGNDEVRISTGARGFGGAGDDFLSIYNGVREDLGAGTLTGGEGQDTFEARIGNFGGPDEGVFAVITDFDPADDVLELSGTQFGPNAGFMVQDVTLIEALDGSHTDVRIDYSATLNGSSGTTYVRLEGVTGLSLDQIVIRT